MPKGLTRNDLLYILNEIFKISTANNNALSFSEQGLFVESYKVHSENGDLHVPSKEVHDIIAGFSLDANDNLIYNGDPASIRISDDEDNAIELDANGALYARKVYDQSDFQEHLDDDERHLTQDDRDKLDDGILNDANDYTDEEINKIKIHNVVYSTSVPPVENMDEHTMYILLDEDNIVENPVIVMKVLNEVVTVGITKATMNLYYTKEECDNKFETIHHAENTYSTKFSNEQVLSQIADDNGHPVFGQGKFLSSRANNGLSCDDNGGLFYPDVASELHSLQISASFAKTNLYDQEITDVGTYTLKDAISNYNLLLMEYWFYPPAFIQVPVYTERLVMHTAEEYKGYTYTFPPSKAQELYDLFDVSKHSSNTNGLIFRFDYEDTRKDIIEMTLKSTSNSGGQYAEMTSNDEYLEYNFRFTSKQDYYNPGTSGGTSGLTRQTEVFTVCKFIDDNDIEHSLALITIMDPDIWSGTNSYFTALRQNGSVINRFSDGGTYVILDPKYIEGTRNFYATFVAKLSGSCGIGHITTWFISKTRSNVKIWYNPSFDSNGYPTGNPQASLNFNAYVQTDIFTDKPGKISFGFYGDHSGSNSTRYKKIYDVTFEQHIYYESLDTVVDRMETIENPEHSIGYAKTALMDTDNMEFLYNRSIGYTLELGYGISNANIKLRMHDDKLYVDHLTNTAIYRITGIGKGQSQEVDPTPDVIIVDDEPQENENNNP